MSELWATAVNTIEYSDIVLSNGIGYVVDFVPSALLAFDLTSGNILWSASLQYSSTEATPAVSNGRVFVAEDDLFWAFDALSGSLLWTSDVEHGEATPAAFDGGLVFFGAGRTLYAFDEVTG
ncbi:MAG: PQQ-binding-like beta-propeller repeat protein, partial [Alphaproteobacteria bacterium]|nr:PQQ-binding-like beta-propeller repeat protein [Alphaproteobacteria bacterium]